MRLILSLLVFAMAVTVTAFSQKRQPRTTKEPPKLKLLFLGDNAGHKPAERFKILQPVFAARNIELTYTDKLTDLNAQNLAKYDGLMIYANQTKISPEQEKALLDFVEAGKGFIPHPLRQLLLPQLAEVRRTGRCAVPQPRDRHVPCRGREARPPDHEGLSELHQLGRDLRPHQAQHEGPHGAGSSRARRSERTVDLGANPREGPRLLHRLGARQPHVGQSRLPQPARTRRALGVRAGPTARPACTSISRR